MPNWSNTSIMFFSKNKEQLEKLIEDIRDCPRVYHEELEEGFNKLKEDGPGFKPFGDDWFGTLLYKLGMITKEQIYEDKIPNHLSCRSRFLNEDYWEDEVVADATANPYLDDEMGWHFMIMSEDAWQPYVDTWDQILMEHYPDVQFVYVSEEPGNGYYCNSDEDRYYFTENYVLDVMIDEGSAPEKVLEQIKDKDELPIELYENFSFEDLKHYMKTVFNGFEEVETEDELEAKLAELEELIEYEAYPDDCWFRLHKFED